LNLRPLVSQCGIHNCSFDTSFNRLSDFDCRLSGLSSGLLHCIKSGRDLVVEDVRVLRGGLDVGMVERLLH
jgi:hypothetical protein